MEKYRWDKELDFFWEITFVENAVLGERDDEDAWITVVKFLAEIDDEEVDNNNEFRLLFEEIDTDDDDDNGNDTVGFVILLINRWEVIDFMILIYCVVKLQN